MNERWDLTPIYESLDAPEYAADMAALGETVKGLEAFAAGLPRADHAQALTEALTLEEKLTGLEMKLATYAELLQSADTRNSRAMSAIPGIPATTAYTALFPARSLMTDRFFFTADFSITSFFMVSALLPVGG